MWRPEDWGEVVEKQSEELDNNRRFDSRDYKIFEAGADAIISALQEELPELHEYLLVEDED